MMGAGEDILKVLARIEAKVDALSKGGGASTATVAPDSDLDGQYGDEEIKKDPPRWKGQAFAPCRMSATSAEYLDEFASFKDWASEKEAGDALALEGDEKAKKLKYSGYSRKSAARARGWAARLRAGWKPPQTDYSKGWD